MEIILKSILPFLAGGAFGSIITIVYNNHKNKIQKMNCHCVDEDVMSKIPITNDDGTTHQNIYTKEFLLKNTTNKDQSDFQIIFEFDATAVILKHTNIGKVGTDHYKSRLVKDNEYLARIKNFNRNDQVKFIFEIANISDNHINITEAKCTGFKIVHKDKRKSKKASKLTFVTKEQLSNN